MGRPSCLTEARRGERGQTPSSDIETPRSPLPTLRSRTPSSFERGSDMLYCPDDLRHPPDYDLCVETAVTRARQVLRLLPAARPRRRVSAAMLDIDPVPVRRRETIDFLK